MPTRTGAHFDLNDIAALASHVGLDIVESGSVAFRLRFGECASSLLPPKN